MKVEDSFHVALNEFDNNIRTIWRTLQSESEFCDMTLACEDKLIQTHKVVMASMSPVIRNILKLNSSPHPFIYLKGVKFKELNNLLIFIHQGQIYIPKEDINSFLEIGKELEINGISGLFDSIRLVSSVDKNEIEASEPVDKSMNDCKMEDDVNEKWKNNEIEPSKLFSHSITESVETIAESIPDCELKEEVVNTINSVTGLNIEENKPVKNVEYVGRVDVNGTEIQPYCNLCNKRYTSLATLNIHHASIHEGVTYPCDSCNYKPSTKGKLSRHTKAVHYGIRLPCDQCNKSFNDGSALTKHKRRIHEGIFQHCEKCGKQFGEKSRLKKHIASFHGE